MRTICFIILLLPAIGLTQENPDPCPYDNSINNTANIYGASVGDYLYGIAWSGWGYRLLNMESNKSYLISLCDQSLYSTFDHQITIFPAGGGQAVAWNDDSDCSTNSIRPYLVFTPPFDGDYDVLWDEYWNDYCQHFNDGLNDYFDFHMEVLSESTSVYELLQKNKKLIKSINILGKEISTINSISFDVYDDGSVEKKYLIK